MYKMLLMFLYISVFEYIISLPQSVQSVHESVSSREKYWTYKTLWKPYEDTENHKNILSEFLSTMSELESLRADVATASNYVDSFFMSDYYANMFSQRSSPSWTTTRFRKREQVKTRFPYRHKQRIPSYRATESRGHTKIISNNNVNYGENHKYEYNWPRQHISKHVTASKRTSIVEYKEHNLNYRPQITRNYQSPRFWPVLLKPRPSLKKLRQGIKPSPKQKRRKSKAPWPPFSSADFETRSKTTTEVFTFPLTSSRSIKKTTTTLTPSSVTKNAYELTKKQKKTKQPWPPFSPGDIESDSKTTTVNTEVFKFPLTSSRSIKKTTTTLTPSSVTKNDYELTKKQKKTKQPWPPFSPGDIESDSKTTTVNTEVFTFPLTPSRNIEKTTITLTLSSITKNAYGPTKGQKKTKQPWPPFSPGDIESDSKTTTVNTEVFTFPLTPSRDIEKTTITLTLSSITKNAYEPTEGQKKTKMPRPPLSPGDIESDSKTTTVNTEVFTFPLTPSRSIKKTTITLTPSSITKNAYASTERQIKTKMPRPPLSPGDIESDSKTTTVNTEVFTFPLTPSRSIKKTTITLTPSSFTKNAHEPTETHKKTKQPWPPFSPADIESDSKPTTVNTGAFKFPPTPSLILDETIITPTTVSSIEKIVSKTKKPFPTLSSADIEDSSKTSAVHAGAFEFPPTPSLSLDDTITIPTVSSIEEILSQIPLPSLSSADIEDGSKTVNTEVFEFPPATISVSPTVDTDGDFETSTGVTTKNASKSKPKPPTNVKAYCYMCGLNETEIPRAPTCYQYFDNTVKHKTSITKFKVHCSTTKSHRRSNKNEFVGDLYRDGCFKRFTDIGKVYNERGCRTMKPTKGKSFASNRLAKLELLLKDQDEGCVESPHASLTPFSRAVSLFVRYHVCVCKGKYCNRTTRLSEPPFATLHLISITHYLLNVFKSN